MIKKSTLRATNYSLAILVILVGIAFALIYDNIFLFLVSFVGSAIIISIYRSTTWDVNERLTYFKNSLEEIKKIECNECGKHSPWWSKYCIFCGYKFDSEEVLCSSCSQENPPLSIHCGVCGRYLNGEDSKNLEEHESERKGSEETEERKEEKKSHDKLQKNIRMECKNCGHQVKSNTRKCPWCGKILDTNEEE